VYAVNAGEVAVEALDLLKQMNKQVKKSGVEMGKALINSVYRKLT
jgi:hypothetical protein